MGLFDWLLTDPTRSDGGFLARMLLGGKPDAANASAAAAGSPALGSSYGGLLGESPLINLLRSGFAGMNAADGYSGFGQQFAAGMKGGADLMAQRHQQMIDQINALKMKQLLEAKGGLPGGDGAAAVGGNPPASGSAGVGTANDGPADRPCAACAGARPAPLKSNLPMVRSDADYQVLPSGTQFIDPLGQIRVKP